jgi:MFS family permease
VGLYTLYSVVYAACAYEAGEVADRVPKPLVLGVGYALFLVACLGFALVGANLVALAALFAVAGAHIGLVETAEGAYAAELLPSERRGTGFGALAAVNGVGDTISSLAVGALWTAIAPQAGFIFGAAFALIALLTLTTLLPWRSR